MSYATVVQFTDIIMSIVPSGVAIAKNTEDSGLVKLLESVRSVSMIVREEDSEPSRAAISLKDAFIYTKLKNDFKITTKNRNNQKRTHIPTRPFLTIVSRIPSEAIDSPNPKFNY